MNRNPGPDLKKYMEKRVSLKLNGNRMVIGVLRGYDQFMNIVLEEGTEVVQPPPGTKGGEILTSKIGTVMVRGNSILQLECAEG